MSFTRIIENFKCGHCGLEVNGNGYTNHCPKCLWSKHVDIDPGDRLAECGGLMSPIGVEKTGEEYMITHKCIKCGFKRRNTFEKQDDFDTLITLSKPTN